MNRFKHWVGTPKRMWNERSERRSKQRNDLIEKYEKVLNSHWFNAKDINDASDVNLSGSYALTGSYSTTHANGLRNTANEAVVAAAGSIAVTADNDSAVYHSVAEALVINAISSTITETYNLEDTTVN